MPALFQRSYFHYPVGIGFPRIPKDARFSMSAQDIKKLGAVEMPLLVHFEVWPERRDANGSQQLRRTFLLFVERDVYDRVDIAGLQIGQRLVGRGIQLRRYPRQLDELTQDLQRGQDVGRDGGIERHAEFARLEVLQGLDDQPDPQQPDDSAGRPVYPDLRAQVRISPMHKGLPDFRGSPSCRRRASGDVQCA